MEALNSVGKPIWIVLMVAGFIWFWPIGLAILAYLLWTGRLGSFTNIGPKMFFGSGNMAFDEHRAEVLKKLEDEQVAFGTFIDNLKKAKDKSEFDQFMSERK